MGAEQAIPQSAGDWGIKSSDHVTRGIDTMFGSIKFYRTSWAAGIAYDAILRTSARFHPDYPGWFFYRRVRHGDCRFDRVLEAYAVGGARGLARSRKANGRRYISGATCRKRGWIAQAGRDALDFAIFGKYPAGLNERAEYFGVHWKTYQAIRDPLAAGMFTGVEMWTAQLHVEFMQLARREYSRTGKPD